MIDQVPSSIEVNKPWGRFEQYTHNLPSTVKIITVAPGGVLSRQYHDQRDVLKVFHPEPGEKLFIPRGTVHRLSAAGEEPVRILEISFGLFDEEDIVRLEDVYGRASTGSDEEPPLIRQSSELQRESGLRSHG